MRNENITLDVNVNKYAINIPAKTIVAGFAGIGKSTAGKKYPNLFIDMESSDYHWITDEGGNKYLNPEWPINYVNAILKATETIKIGEPFYVLTSTHSEVLEEFKKRQIYYMVVIPKTKSVALKRYKERGSSPKFIKSMENNFDKYIQDVKNSSAFLIYTTDMYLEDIFIPSK